MRLSIFQHILSGRTKMSKKKKITLISVFVAVVAVAAIVAVVLNQKSTTAGVKNFKVQIVSERDGYDQTTDCKSDAEFLGEFLRNYSDCEYQESDYGIYVTGFDGMKEDLDNQYWWCISVNGEAAVTGADEIPLQDGDTYNFTLKQGW